MKTKSLLLLTLLCIFATTQAQFTSVGTEWHFGSFTGMFPGVEGHRLYKAVSKVAIAGDSFTVISGGTKNYHLSQDSTAVFYSVNSLKYLLFNSDHQLGDTLFIDARFNHPLLAGIDTVVNLRIKITHINYFKDNALDPNDSLKEFVFDDLDSVCMTLGYLKTGFFTEKVVHRHGIYPLPFDELFPTIIQDGEGLYLRCFNSGPYNYKTTQSGNMPCDFSNVGISEIPFEIPSPVNIYPNPSAADYVIESGEDIIRIMIYDIQGRLVKIDEPAKGTKRYEVETTGMARGLYQSIITTTRASCSRKLILR